MPTRCLAVLILSLSGQAQALSTDRDQPVQIEADQANIDDIKRITVYLGNVKVTQGSMEVQADKVTLNYDTDKNVELIIAEGKPVKFKQRPDNRDQDIQAFAQRVEYHVKNQILNLSANAEIRQGQDSFKGDKMVYDVQRSTLNARSRVMTVINPNPAKTADKPAAGKPNAKKPAGKPTAKKKPAPKPDAEPEAAEAETAAPQ
jgi:lipopolysaccharide export system protein LptA